jgi:hypothetical protein
LNLLTSKTFTNIVVNPQEKKFFSFLAQIEREHMLSMKDSLFYLEDPEGWFESNGRAGLDGA